MKEPGKKGTVKGSGRYTAQKKKSPAKNDLQNELFDPEDFEPDEDLGDDQGGLQHSSRKMRLLARDAAVEMFPYRDREHRSEESSGKKRASSKKKQSVKKPTSAKKVSSQAKKPPASKRPVSQKRRKQRRELIKFGSIALALVAAAVVITILVLRQNDPGYETAMVETEQGLIPYIDAETPFGDELRIYIERGMTADEVCRLLDKAGVVANANRLQSYLISHKLDTSIQSGPIFLPREMSYEDAATAISRGFWEHPIIYIYSGYTIAQIDRFLAQSGLADSGDFTRQAELLVLKQGLAFTEGYFYPDEYILASLDNAAASLAEQMYSRFENITGPLLEQLEIAGRTLEEAVIVASMIQRETANPDEMPLISGIIWKRLDEGIPLGIDATTRYEIDDWSNPLTKAVLDNPTPYNTRRKRGLPPTGIANPGFEALHAAVYPETSPYYYYLHDRSAQIHFAETYEEHLENVNNYLR